MRKQVNFELEAALQNLIQDYGIESVAQSIKRIRSSSEDEHVCTIIVNQGLHFFPEDIINGEVYTFSTGSLNLDSEEILKEQVSFHLLKLADFLKSKKWKEVYIVISGHAAICMQVKLAVYRITHIYSKDWVFDGAGKYKLLDISTRNVLVR